MKRDPAKIYCDDPDCEGLPGCPCRTPKTENQINESIIHFITSEQLYSTNTKMLGALMLAHSIRLLNTEGLSNHDVIELVNFTQEQIKQNKNLKDRKTH